MRFDRSLQRLVIDHVDERHMYWDGIGTDLVYAGLEQIFAATLLAFKPLTLYHGSERGTTVDEDTVDPRPPAWSELLSYS